MIVLVKNVCSCSVMGRLSGLKFWWNFKVNLTLSFRPNNVNFLRWNLQQRSVIFFLFLYVIDLTFSIHDRTDLKLNISLTKDDVFLIRLWPVGM